jgi:RNA polymerase sigma-70 factor (ECF subfamily)
MAINRATRRGPAFGTDPEMLDAVAGGGKAPEHDLEMNEAKAELHEGLKQLKAMDRETLEAFYLRGQTLEQMANEFEAPVGTIKRRLHVARHRLKEVLEGRKADPFDAEVGDELLAV